MAANATVTIRMDAALKQQAEKICDDMGLTMSAAITIFTKRLVRDRAIPFTVSAEGDHFYSENNLRHLQVAAEEMDRGYYVKHDIIEDEKP